MPTRTEPPQPLTPRIAEVWRFIGPEVSNRLIAWELVLSEKTVKVRVSTILAKLGVADRTQGMYAVRRGPAERLALGA